MAASKKKTKIATLALDLLSRHSLNPTPANYKIAYEYVTGTDDKIVAVFNEYEAIGMRLDAVGRQKLGIGAVVNNDVARLTSRIMAAMSEHMAKDAEGTNAIARSIADSIEADGLGSLDVAGFLQELSTQVEQQRILVESSKEQIADLSVQLKEAQEQNGRDPMTGLSNRRVIDAHIKALSKEQSAHGIAMIDIDHFKRINDTYGHGMGDRVITRIGEMAGEEFDDCLVGRYGGEEYIVAFNVDGGDMSVGRLESFRRRVEREKWQVRQGEPPLEKVTVSIGYARRAVNDNTTGEQLVAAADANLYHAKDSGRNCIKSTFHADLKWKDAAA